MVRRNLVQALVAGLSAVGLSGASAQPTALKPIREFTELVAGLMRDARPGAKIIVVDDATISVEGAAPQHGANKVFTDHFYGEYRSGAMTFEKAAQKLIAGMSAAVPEIAKDALVPIVRPLDYASGAGVTWKIRTRPLGGDLMYVLAVDGEQSLSIPSVEKLDALKLDEQSLWAIGAANVPKRMGALKIELFHPSVWTLTSPNDLGLSVLAVDDFWAHPPIALKGRPAVAAIQRNLLVIVDTSDAKALESVRLWLKNLRTDPDTMSTALLVRNGATWTEF